MKFGPLYIFGVVGGSSTGEKIWDHFRVYGLLDRYEFGDADLSCCLMYKQNGTINITGVTPLVKRMFLISAEMWNFYVACPNTKSIFGIIPQGVAVTAFRFSCSENHVTYVMPYYPAKKSNKMAIGTKTAFGDVNAEQIIEWMEAYRYSFFNIQRQSRLHTKGLYLNRFKDNLPIANKQKKKKKKKKKGTVQNCQLQNQQY